MVIISWISYAYAVHQSIFWSLNDFAICRQHTGIVSVVPHHNMSRPFRLRYRTERIDWIIRMSILASFPSSSCPGMSPAYSKVNSNDDRIEWPENRLVKCTCIRNSGYNYHDNCEMVRERERENQPTEVLKKAIPDNECPSAMIIGNPWWLNP